MRVTSCLFFGGPADTQEHIIPDWLQRRFNLQRQSYHLPNATSFDYRHARVPAARDHNRLFGQIEARISRNQFVWEEIYLWLCKIHIGLMARDVTLPKDIRDPSSPSMVPLSQVDNQLSIFVIYIIHTSPSENSLPGHHRQDQSTCCLR